jgi:hypothetical protein
MLLVWIFQSLFDRREYFDNERDQNNVYEFIESGSLPPNLPGGFSPVIIVDSSSRTTMEVDYWDTR